MYSCSAEFDLTDLTGVRCKVSCTGEDAICSDEFATKVIQRYVEVENNLHEE